MNRDSILLNKACGLISQEVGLLSYISKLPTMQADPNLIAYGIWPCNTSVFSQERFAGRSSGCGTSWENAMLTTLGETVERYCPSIYDLNDGIKATYKNLNKPAVHPSEYALFHEKQYESYREKNYRVVPFTEDIELHWFQTMDLTTGKESWCPGGFVYLPWTKEERWVTLNTSTGLAAHSDFYKSILSGLYECIERDSFVLSWSHEMFREKIVITPSIESYLNSIFPASYEWNFFDINYDLETPSVFGICFGEADFGKFVAVGTSTKGTYREAMQKVILEIGQAVSYFRYLLGEKKDWQPSDDFDQLRNFEDHSIFYLKRPDLLHVFDKWRNAKPSKIIDFEEENSKTPKQELNRLLKMFKRKGYNVLTKDLTTPDVRSCGFFATSAFVPQLIQMNGAYPFYFHGGKRLYEVPRQFGLSNRSYDELNPYPHPFP